MYTGSNEFAITVKLLAESSAIHTDRFAEHVNEMHVMRDKGFEEEFKVSEKQP